MPSRAHFQQLVPISTGTRQARHLNAEHQAHVAETNFRNETLEAGTMQRRRRRPTKVVIDDDHLILAPAKLAGTVRQRVLQTCRLLVLQHLAHCRLPNIDNRLSLTVPGLDFVRGQQGSAWHRRAHDLSPD